MTPVTHFPRVSAIHPTGSKAPFFWIGPGVVHYNLIRKLDPDRPLFGMSIGSPDDKEAPCTFEDVAALHVRALRSVQPNGPYLLGGHCLAGAIAFEVGRQLAAEGEQVEMLALFDPVSAPSPKSSPQSSRTGLRSWAFKAKVRIHNLQALGAKEKFSYLLIRIVERFLTRTWWTDQLFSVVDHCRLPRTIRVRLEKLRTNSQTVLWAFHDYRPQTYPGELHIFRARIQNRSNAPVDLGWSQYAQLGASVQEVPGNHTTMFMKPNVDLLAQMLNLRFQGPSRV